MEIGGGSDGGGEERTPREHANPKAGVAELLQKLNLTVEE